MSTGAQRIADWFTANSDGNREHQNGITIATTDNPGWYVTIDLEDSNVEKLTASQGKRDGMSWQIADGQLIGYDEETGNLEGLLNLLADILEANPGADNSAGWLLGIAAAKATHEKTDAAIVGLFDAALEFAHEKGWRPMN